MQSIRSHEIGCISSGLGFIGVNVSLPLRMSLCYRECRFAAEDVTSPSTQYVNDEKEILRTENPKIDGHKPNGIGKTT